MSSMIEWQPIETAPTGVLVLLMRKFTQAEIQAAKREGGLRVGWNRWLDFKEPLTNEWGCESNKRIFSYDKNPTHWSPVAACPDKGFL